MNFWNALVLLLALLCQTNCGNMTQTSSSCSCIYFKMTAKFTEHFCQFLMSLCSKICIYTSLPEIPEKGKAFCSKQRWFIIPFISAWNSHTIHGTGIFNSIYHTNKPWKCRVNRPFVTWMVWDWQKPLDLWDRQLLSFWDPLVECFLHHEEIPARKELQESLVP